jgi:glycosyltransferase involved in cell wall biosynthesis
MTERAGLVSVVLPTRDRPAFLREAVDSVRAQTYDDVELLVVDGSTEPVEDRVPTDGSIECRYLRQSGEGAAAARNEGIRAARGELLAFLDDDDTWDPEKLERQVETLRAADEEVGFVYTGQRYVDDDGATAGIHAPHTRGDVTRELYRGAPLSPFSSVLVRASLVEAAGYVDERLPVWEDRDWYIRLSRHCHVEPIPEPLVARCVGEHDQLTDDFEAMRDVAYPRFLAKHRPIAASYGASCERLLVANLSMAVASAAFTHGHRRESLTYLLRALRHDPLRPRRYLYLLLFVGGQPALRAARALRRAYVGFRAD